MVKQIALSDNEIQLSVRLCQSSYFKPLYESGNDLKTLKKCAACLLRQPPFHLNIFAMIFLGQSCLAKSDKANHIQEIAILQGIHLNFFHKNVSLIIQSLIQKLIFFGFVLEGVVFLKMCLLSEADIRVVL